MLWTISQAPRMVVPGTATCVFRVVADGSAAQVAHVHPDLHQLTWFPDGDALARFGDVVWILPPAAAVWVPAGVTHAVRGRVRGGECLDLKIHHRFATAAGPHPALVAMTPLLQSLLRHLAEPGLPVAERRRAEPVVSDQLRAAAVVGPDVPMPADPRARRVAEAFLADPADPRGVDEWARSAATSTRTLERLVRDGTGMSFRTWRTRIRVAAAIGPLTAGEPVSAVARRVGYRHAGAFGEAFRAVVGCAPSRYRTLVAAGAWAGEPLLHWNDRRDDDALTG